MVTKITPRRAIGGEVWGTNERWLRQGFWTHTTHMQSSGHLSPPPPVICLSFTRNFTRSLRKLQTVDILWPLCNADWNLIPTPLPPPPPFNHQLKNHWIYGREVTQVSKLSKGTQLKQKKKKKGAENHQAFSWHSTSICWINKGKTDWRTNVPVLKATALARSW